MILKKVFLIIVYNSLCLLPVAILGQAGARSLQTPDTLKTALGGSSHSLFAGGGYGSNMIYLGSTISHNQPYGYWNVTYGYKNQFYASASAVHLSGIDPFLSFYIGALNYSHAFNSWFDIATGVYRYQVPSSLTDTLFRSFTYGDLTFGFDWKLLYSKLSVGGYFQKKTRLIFKSETQGIFRLLNSLTGKQIYHSILMQIFCSEH